MSIDSLTACCNSDSLRGWANDIPPNGSFAGDSAYTWTIEFTEQDLLKNCVEYVFDAGACPESTRAEIELGCVAVLDGLGHVDTLLVTGGAHVWPESNAISVSGVFPSEVARFQATDLHVGGHGFQTGARVFLQRNGQRAEATEVTVLDSTQLQAHVASPFRSPGTLDLVVEHPAGSEGTLSAGMWTAGATAPAPTLHRPTND